jgi:hypothetical protein
LDQRGCTPCFRGKSAEDMGRVGDRLDTENERVRKRLKRKRVKSGDWEKRERKCRRADIFVGVHPLVFAYVGETKELRTEIWYAGETKGLEAQRIGRTRKPVYPPPRGISYVRE